MDPPKVLDSDDEESLADLEAGTAALPEEVEKNKGFLKPLPNQTPLERFFYAVAFAVSGVALLSVITYPLTSIWRPFCYIAAALSCGMACYAYFQQTQLTEIKALEEAQIVLESEVSRMKLHNAELGTNIETMGETVGRLKGVKKTFDEVTNMQGFSVDQFEGQVARNRKILATMQSQIHDIVTQTLISVLEFADSNNDNIIEAAEVDVVLKKLKGVKGVEVREDLFRKHFTGKSTDVFEELIRDVAQEKLPEPERIFVFVTDEEEKEGEGGD